MQIHLVGALHNDPQGYVRTKRALNKFQPDIVGVEWAGDEYDRFTQSTEIKQLQAKMEKAIKAVFARLGLDPSLYERANKISAQNSNSEVMAAREYAFNSDLLLMPTESAELKIEMKRNQLHNVDDACQQYHDWLTHLTESGEKYDPETITSFDPREYDYFEAHLAGQMPQEDVRQWLNDGYIPDAINEPRVRYQVEQIREGIELLYEGEVLVHVGGLAHLIDDGLAETARGPINLWQHLVNQFRERVLRHSLRAV
ncbi:MAG: hypothetical protein ABIH78_04970 [Candidatus Peregrinibacteria bacterium]